MHHFEMMKIHENPYNSFQHPFPTGLFDAEDLNIAMFALSCWVSSCPFLFRSHHGSHANLVGELHWGDVRGNLMES